ncbi:MAG: restriction endonuclease subunit S [Flavobacterium sp.]|uniref:restriction endonuclease subunit S n=1 Tax=Flavobacterium sp. TaxID=239 RepID=UPI003BE04A3E
MSLMRIDDLFHFEKGILQSSKCTEGEFDFITASSEWKTHNEYTHDCEALVFAAAASGSLGRTHYVNGKFISSDLCFIITAKDPIKLPIDLKFYHMIFNEFKNDIVNSTKAGTSKEAIGMKAFGNYKLPYFEINKQIDTKVQFVNMQDSKVELNVELTHQIDLIKQMRQAFLREAMQGKLVKSTNTKETGQQFLAKIKAEKSQLIAEKKLKKEKELAPISEDEIPFEIPEYWTWCRLGEICTLITDGKHGDCKNEPNSGYYFLSAKDIQNGQFIYDGARQITYDDFLETHRRTNLEPGDLCIVNTGATIGKSAFAPEDEKTKNTTFQKSVAVIKVIKEHTNMRFVENFIINETPRLLKKSRGSAINNLLLGDMRNTLFPLPPLHEQEQIVAKLEELMAFCDGLEQSIKESQGYNEKLLQQVLREALQGKEV